MLLLVLGVLAVGFGVCVVFDVGGFTTRKAKSAYEQQRDTLLMDGNLQGAGKSAPNTIGLRASGILLVFMGLLMVLIGLADMA